MVIDQFCSVLLCVHIGGKLACVAATWQQTTYHCYSSCSMSCLSSPLMQHQALSPQSRLKLCMQIVSPCHCGKVSKPVRCSQASFSCGKLCGKRLACGHRCPHKCHPGTCPECMLTATVSCHCGAETQTLPCSQRDFRCDRACGKVLACGRHKCEKVCHDGSCGGCPMEGPRLCPCGKVSGSMHMSMIPLLLIFYILNGHYILGCSGETRLVLHVPSSS